MLAWFSLQLIEVYEEQIMSRDYDVKKTKCSSWIRVIGSC